jgi:uncharacterized membrane protein HdeD (DUF308 family)
MASRGNPETDAAYWYVPLVRAIPAALLALAITFSKSHTPELGFVAFGSFAVVSGVAVVLLHLRSLPGGRPRTAFVVQGAATVLAGIIALVFATAGVPLLLVLVSSWAAVTGIVELYSGIGSRRAHPAARDWVFIGALTAVLAIAVLLVPPGFTQHFVGPDGLPGVLNAGIIVVGLLGLYGAVETVYLVIAALTLKWGPSTVPAPAIDASTTSQETTS